MNHFGVSAEKAAELAERMRSLDIREADLEENFIRGSGRGGQKINKTSSCVQLLHRPTGIEVRCQHDRSQAINRFLARRLLCNKIEAKLRGVESAQEQERERIRRQKRRRSRRAKEKMLHNKHQRAGVKEQRKKVREDT